MTAGRMPIRLTTLRPMRDGAIVACVVLAIAHFTGYVQTGVDAHSYWASNPLDPYGAVRPGQQDAYFYAPVFTQLLGPLHLLPWPAFIGLWTLFLSAALVWQAGLWTGIALLFVPVFADLTVGNIHLLLAAAIVAGFRWPWLWALPLLTKITPGVGLLWFVVRREWRNLAIALGATVALSLVSFIIAPGLWFGWVEALVAATKQPDHEFLVPIQLWIRMAAAGALVVWGARTDRRWTVPVSAMLALPILWINGMAMLIGVVALVPALLGPTPATRWLSGAGSAGPPPSAAPAVRPSLPR